MNSSPSCAPECCVYLLTNSRAFPPDRACALNREIGLNLTRASALTGRALAIISRSDSTLRGHFPHKTDALAAALGGDFNGTLPIPAFFAGGRLTINDTLYVAEGNTFTRPARPSSLATQPSATAPPISAPGSRKRLPAASPPPPAPISPP